MASPKATGSPKPTGSPKATGLPIPVANSMPLEEMDMSIISWLSNTHSMLQWPVTILSVAGLLVAGTFAEIAPRKSLEILDNTLGSCLFFIFPFVIAIFLDWSTGLLAAVVSLIIFARLQKKDATEGFSDSVDNTNEQSTKLISNSNRWFIERILGERPIAISSGRIITQAVQDEDVHRSSASSNYNSIQSSSSSYK